MSFITKYLKNIVIFIVFIFNILNILTILEIINNKNYIIGYSRETPLTGLTYILYFLLTLLFLKIFLLFLNDRTIKGTLFLNILKWSILLFNIVFFLGTGFLFYKIYLMGVGQCESIRLGFTGLHIFRIYTNDELFSIGASFFKLYYKETICFKLQIGTSSFDELISKDALSNFETPKDVYNYIKNIIDVWDKETFLKTLSVVSKSPSSYSTNELVLYTLAILLLSGTCLYGVSYFLGYSGLFGYFTWGNTDNKSDTVSDKSLEQVLLDNKNITKCNKDIAEDHKAISSFINYLKDKQIVDHDKLLNLFSLERKYILNIIKKHFVLKGNSDASISMLYKELKKLNNNQIDQALKDLFE